MMGEILIYLFELGSLRMARKSDLILTPILFGIVCLLAAGSSASQGRPSEPSPLRYTPLEVHANDTPDDGGTSLTVKWILPAADSLLSGYVVFRRSSEDTAFAEIGRVGKGSASFLDQRGVNRDLSYVYKVAGFEGEHLYFSGESPPAQPKAQWFNKKRLNILLAVIVLTALLLWFLRLARQGERLFIRKIAGLDAVDEAVGRATEMGRSIFYSPGLDPMDEVATVASMAILGQVAKKAAQHETKLVVPNRDPIVMTVAQQVVKEAYASVGRPDLYVEEDVYYVTYSQFGYAAGVTGRMMREKPATNFFVGRFYAESLILAETGNATGAIQIAATDSDAQLPFFITSCDYTLIGEELYAASVYLSREPMLMGTLKGQDKAKLVMILVTIVASILTFFGVDSGIFFGR